MIEGALAPKGRSPASRKGAKDKKLSSSSSKTVAKRDSSKKEQRPSSGYRGSAESAAQSRKQSQKNDLKKRRKSSKDDEESDELVALNAQEGLDIQQDSEVIEPKSDRDTVSKEVQRIKENIDKRLN